jgi:hypothetical protein
MRGRVAALPYVFLGGKREDGFAADRTAQNAQIIAVTN